MIARLNPFLNSTKDGCFYHFNPLTSYHTGLLVHDLNVVGGSLRNHSDKFMRFDD